MTLASQKFGIADIKKALLEYKEMAAQHEDRRKDVEQKGVPPVVIELEERIYEGLSTTQRKDWPRRFASAICGDLDELRFWWQFALWLLDDAKEGLLAYATSDDQRQAIGGVSDLYRAQKVEMPQWTVAAQTCSRLHDALAEAGDESEAALKARHALSAARWAATAGASYQSAREMHAWAQAANEAGAAAAKQSESSQVANRWASTPGHVAHAANQAEQAAYMAATLSADLTWRANAFKRQSEKLLELISSGRSAEKDEQQVADAPLSALEDLRRICFAYLETRQQTEARARKAESLGVPLMLLKIEDRMLQPLPQAMARDWAERFVSVVRPAAELGQVFPQLAVWLLTDAKTGVITMAASDEEKYLIKAVADLYRESSLLEPIWNQARERCAAACGAGGAQQADLKTPESRARYALLVAAELAAVGEGSASVVLRRDEVRRTADSAAEHRDAALKELSLLQADEAQREEARAATLAAGVVGRAMAMSGTDSTAVRAAHVAYCQKLLELLRCA